MTDLLPSLKRARVEAESKVVISTSRWTKVPASLLEAIYLFSDPRTLAAAARVCRSWRNLDGHDTTTFWRQQVWGVEGAGPSSLMAKLDSFAHHRLTWLSCPFPADVEPCCDVCDDGSSVAVAVGSVVTVFPLPLPSQGTPAAASWTFMLPEYLRGYQSLRYRKTAQNQPLFLLQTERVLTLSNAEAKQSRVAQFAGHTRAINGIDLNVAAGLLVTASVDGTLRTWPLCLQLERPVGGHRPTSSHTVTRDSAFNALQVDWPRGLVVTAAAVRLEARGPAATSSAARHARPQGALSPRRRHGAYERACVCACVGTVLDPRAWFPCDD